MSRPKKWWTVCGLPESDRFAPLNKRMNHDHFLIMSVDEYETIRLIDLEGLTQEDCAKRMDIARTTVQGIYANARKKLAEFLVQGKGLRIEGGNYKLCNDLDKSCGGGAGCRHRFRRNGREW